MRILRPFLVIALVFSCGAFLVAQERQRASLPEQQKSDAVTVVRLRNTAEFRYKTQEGRFATLEALLSSGKQKSKILYSSVPRS